MTMTAAHYKNRDDFSTSTGAQRSPTRLSAERAARAAQITGTRAVDHFCQGFTHAGQRRVNLGGKSPNYDAGHAAGMIDRKIASFVENSMLLTGPRT